MLDKLRKKVTSLEFCTSSDVRLFRLRIVVLHLGENWDIQEKVNMLALLNRFLDWLKSIFWKEEMELTLVGLQYSGKTTFVNVISVSNFRFNLMFLFLSYYYCEYIKVIFFLIFNSLIQRYTISWHYFFSSVFIYFEWTCTLFGPCLRCNTFVYYSSFLTQN